MPRSYVFGRVPPERAHHALRTQDKVLPATAVCGFRPDGNWRDLWPEDGELSTQGWRVVRPRMCRQCLKVLPVPIRRRLRLMPIS